MSGPDKSLISADVKLAATALPAIEAFLVKHVTDADKVQSFLSSLVGQDTADVLKNVGAFILSFVTPPGTASSMLNLAIELAYSVLKAKK